MFTRGRFLFNLSLMFLGFAGTTSAGVAALEIHIHNDAGLPPATLDQLMSQVQAILTSAGASVEVRTCQGKDNPWCQQPSADARVLYVRILPGEGPKIKNMRNPALGASVADETGGAYGSVFLATIKDQAHSANVPWNVVAAYATAHEIGHLLLGSNAHTRNGVMKDTWDTKDLLAMFQNRVHFTREQQQLFANCCGALHPHVAMGDSPQFAFDERNQFVQTLFIPGLPAKEQFGYRFGSLRLQDFFPRPLCLTTDYSASARCHGRGVNHSELPLGGDVKATLLIPMLFSSAVGLAAEGPKPPATPSLTIRVYNTSSASVRDFDEMKENATRVLKHSGIEVEWIGCVPRSQESVVCEEYGGSRGRTIILVRLIDAPVRRAYQQGQEERTPLGWANQPTLGIAVVYKTACAMEQNAPGIVTKGQILGHAVAHEIGHLLFASHDHSTVGIMKANYNLDDLYEIARGYLLFTSEESRLLRRSLLSGSGPSAER